ncbi:MAG: hypothetical protein LAT82_05875, partial [Nanoarchaeota archaeon]|nr:hypothetical protein [Nanoarchaeota archaeon]
MNNFFTLLVLFIFSFSLSFGDNNGIWTYPEDIRAGVFGADEGLTPSQNYTFNNIVYFNVGLESLNIDVANNIAMGGTLVSGEVPWARLSNHRSVLAGAGLVGGGALNEDRTLSLNSTILDGSHYDSRFVNRAGDTMSGSLTVEGDVNANRFRSRTNTGYLLNPSGSSTLAGVFADAYYTRGFGNYFYLRPAQLSRINDLQVDGDINLGGTLVSGEVPWSRLSGYPSIVAGAGLVGGGVLNEDRTINLNSNILDGSAYDSRFVQEGQENSISTSMIQNNAVTSAKIASNSVRIDELDTSSVDERYVNKAGDTMSGNLNVQADIISNRIRTNEYCDSTGDDCFSVNDFL